MSIALNPVYVVQGVTAKGAWVVGVYQNERTAVALRKRLQERANAWFSEMAEKIHDDPPVYTNAITGEKYTVEPRSLERPTAHLRAALGEDPEARFCASGVRYYVVPSDLHLSV